MAIITRECTKCRKSFPATTAFFYLRRDTVGSKQYEYFRRECRECCQSQTASHYVPTVRQQKPKESIRTCTKCKRSLPATTDCFWTAITIKNGKRYEGIVLNVAEVSTSNIITKMNMSE